MNIGVWREAWDDQPWSRLTSQSLFVLKGHQAQFLGPSKFPKVHNFICLHGQAPKIWLDVATIRPYLLEFNHTVRLAFCEFHTSCSETFQGCWSFIRGQEWGKSCPFLFNESTTFFVHDGGFLPCWKSFVEVANNLTWRQVAKLTSNSNLSSRVNHLLLSRTKSASSPQSFIRGTLP